SAGGQWARLNSLPHVASRSKQSGGLRGGGSTDLDAAPMPRLPRTFGARHSGQTTQMARRIKIVMVGFVAVAMLGIACGPKKVALDRERQLMQRGGSSVAAGGPGSAAGAAQNQAAGSN